MAIFSKRHYKKLAEAIGSAGLNFVGRENTIDSFIRTFMIDNPNFDCDKFRDAVYHAESLNPRKGVTKQSVIQEARGKVKMGDGFYREVTKC